jgi:hypothetical protein
VLPATKQCLQGFCEFLRCYRSATEVLPSFVSSTMEGGPRCHRGATPESKVQSRNCLVATKTVPRRRKLLPPRQGWKMGTTYNRAMFTGVFCTFWVQQEVQHGYNVALVLSPEFKVLRPESARCFFPPAGGIQSATSVYKCDKGLFAGVLCIFRVCTEVCTKCNGAASQVADKDCDKFRTEKEADLPSSKALRHGGR